MLRTLCITVLGGVVTCTGLLGSASAQLGAGGGLAPGSSFVPFSEREYNIKSLYGADADAYWRSHWDWYDNNYRPYYRGYRHHSRRPILDYSDRYPATAPEYHDFYNYRGRTERLRTPSYYYPSTGHDARLYRDYDWR